MIDMALYLVQHGEAKSEQEDKERPLSGKGRQEADAVAKKMAEAEIKAERIYHSPKLRALQTAEIFAARLGSQASAMEGLKPMDDPA